MEIEKKYLVDLTAVDLSKYSYRLIEQGYLSTQPVVRVRREEDTYYLTYKSKGLMVREEANLPLDETSYQHLIKKSDGTIITKWRYLIPYSYIPLSSSDETTCTIELDVFKDALCGLVIAEVEFPSVDAANDFVAPFWFTREVTQDARYQNSNLIYVDSLQIAEMC